MNSVKIKLFIDGMTCSNCKMIIEKKLKSMKGISYVKASYSKGEVEIDLDKGTISTEEIKKVINELDVYVIDFVGKKQFISNTESLYILIIILSVYFVLNHFQLLNFSNYFPKIQVSMGYGMLFIIGLLNGLMPCGPLQSMQLYALSTGSIVAGAFSMFLFSLGTVPLMFILGTISSKLNKTFTNKMLSICAMLVVVLGVGMINNGLSLSGILIPQIQSAEVIANTAQVEGEYQTITTALDFGRYQPITVKAGILVKWTIKAEKGKVNGCNNEIIIHEYNIKMKLKEGDNLIEFMPTEAGQFGYSCWMGMIRSSITVIE